MRNYNYVASVDDYDPIAVLNAAGAGDIAALVEVHRDAGTSPLD